MEGYSAEGNQVVMKMKNAWLGALSPHTTGYWALANIDTWNAAGGSDPSSTYGTETADGTGPFTHTEWVPGSHSLVTRWDEYPGNNTPFIANKGTAYLDSIRWSVITEAGQRATQLESGDLDTLIGPSYADLDRLRGNSDLTVIQHPEWSGYHLVMNRDYPEFFGDMLTRQGLSHALNRQAMVDAILFGNGDPTYGPFPKTDRQYEPKVESTTNTTLSSRSQNSPRRVGHLAATASSSVTERVLSSVTSWKTPLNRSKLPRQWRRNLRKLVLSQHSTS
jgi:ABC-type transport system substrate-binding protein